MGCLEKLIRRQARWLWGIPRGLIIISLWILVLGSGVGCDRHPAAESRSLASSNAMRTGEWFEDITDQAGLHFVHDAGATGRYFMPEHLGSGGAFFDFDNDGLLDLYLVQNGNPAARSSNQLYHHEANGTFRDVSAASGLDILGRGMGVAVADINNDGWVDVLVTEYGAVHLFLNRQDGTFLEITAAAGLENPRWATSAAFFDFDRDGWLDLVIANYVDYDPTHACPDAKGKPEYCGPHGFAGTVTQLFRNLGATNPPRFANVTVPSGLARSPGPALGVVCADFDGDHWPDIFVADDGRPNRLFLNQHDGTFREGAAQHGLAFTTMGQTAGNMGVALADINGDGLLDLFVTHLSKELHSLWLQTPRGFFQDRAAASGLARAEIRGTGFGAVLADFDLDGFPDLALVNGGIERGLAPGSVMPGVGPYWAPYAQRPELWVNEGSGNFRGVASSNPAFCSRATVGRGLIAGDFDNDGAMDLVVTSVGSPARLFHNIAPRRGHWLTVRAVNPAHGGRDEIGAEILIRAGGKQFSGMVNPASGYLCSHDPRAHFGLGSGAVIESIEIYWPDGASEIFPGGAVDTERVLRRGTGRPSRP